jgi:fatty acid CoA ligase FadD36
MESGVTVAGETLSAEALRLAANAVAADVDGEPVVAIDATPTLSTVVAMVGALSAGATVVPLPPDSGTAELEHMLSDSGATVVLGRERSRHRTLPIDPSRRDHREPPPVDEDRVAMLMYTSGTTGAPKGVMLTHRAIAAGIDAVAAAWDWTPDDTLVHGLPLFHVHGLILGLLGPLRVGGRLIHTGRPVPEAYAAAAGTLYFGVPTVWSRICADPASATALSGARLLVSGSAPLPVPVFERLRELTGQAPVERYGMTETLITLSGRADSARRAGYVGFPTQGVRTMLRDDDGSPVPHDGSSIGELLVRGPMLGSGYWQRPEATAASWHPDGWFRTGDIASIDADGWHRIVGRASTDLIKSGGYRIGAGEVEDALLAHPAVREAAVIGTPDPTYGERVTAYVVADGVDAAALAEFVGGYLSAHKRPRHIEFVESLPRNAMGKVQKKLLGS